VAVKIVVIFFTYYKIIYSAELAGIVVGEELVMVGVGDRSGCSRLS
jgi:hypothetical protein